MSLYNPKVDSVFYEIRKKIGHHTLNMTKTVTKLNQFTLRVPLPEYHLVSAFIQHSLWKSGKSSGMVSSHHIVNKFIIYSLYFQIRGSQLEVSLPPCPREYLATGGDTSDVTTWGLLMA